ncbi:MAG: glycoside hydrolase family 3 protein [Clostridia bacterium]|nr:glycoside hydrolase family 3 protein [Clostridia bacterium]
MNINNLTLREKIGQTMCMLCEREAHIRRFGSVEKMLERYPIGSLYACKGMENGMMLSIDMDEFKSCAEEYNSFCKIPLLKMGEAAWKSEKTVSFSSSMGLGAANDVDLAYRLGKISGQNAKRSGTDMVLSPVVDLNMSPDSPVINTRAYGDTPERVIPIAGAYIRGVQQQGVAACAKHFPGPDDKECIDPHLAPADNLISREKWDATNGKVYQEIIKEGVYTIMSGHQNLVAYQTEKIDDRYPSATVSYELITKLLKNRLGFGGMVVTDALCMGGFIGTNGLENQVRCLTAGNDMLLWPSFEYMDEVEKRVLNGEIPMERIDDAVKRVLELKEKLGLLMGAERSVRYDEKEAETVSREIAGKSITLVRNIRGVIPSADIKKVLIVIATPSERSGLKLKYLKECFERFGIKADVLRDTTQEEIKEKQDSYDLVMFALCRTTHDPIGPLEFWGNNASTVWASNSCDLSKSLVVSFGTPYSFKYYKCTQMTYINAYSPDEEVQAAVVERILGKKPFEGVSPVKL